MKKWSILFAMALAGFVSLGLMGCREDESGSGAEATKEQVEGAPSPEHPAASDAKDAPAAKKPKDHPAH